MAVATLVAGSAGGGCSRGARSSPAIAGSARDASEVTTLTFKGKPRDLDAAASRSLPEFGLAVLEQRGGYDEGVREYELLGIRGQTGVLRAEFEPAAGSLEKRRTSQTITLSARLGRFGEPAEEKALLQRMRTEMRRLDRTP